MPRALRRGTWWKSTAPRRVRSRFRRSAATIYRPPDARYRLGDRARRYVEVCDEPDALLAAFRVEENPFCTPGFRERPRPGPQVDVDEEEVGLGHRATEPTDRLQLLGEPASALVVLGK